MKKKILIFIGVIVLIVVALVAYTVVSDLKQEEVLKSFEKICENSVYSYKRQICDGYITIRGGNRVGIVGSAVVENGQVININYISSLNFRIAREKIGCSDNMIKQIINYETNSIYNTLIISPPGGGKTTLLRDIVRNLSNGFEDFKGKTIGVVDERGEIAAMCKGIPQNNVGIRTDVIDNMPKPEAMRILVRSMCPDIIACDEIGSKEDVDAIDYVMCSGVKGIFTAHGGSIEEIKKNPELSKLFNKNVFERIVSIGVNWDRVFFDTCQLGPGLFCNKGGIYGNLKIYIINNNIFIINCNRINAFKNV